MFFLSLPYTVDAFRNVAVELFHAFSSLQALEACL